VRVETVLTATQLWEALSGGKDADGKTGAVTKDFGELTRIVPMGSERLLIQLFDRCKMFAVDVKTARVESVTHPFGASFWRGWLFRDRSTADGLILCTDDGTVAFNTRTGAVQRLCESPDLSSGSMSVMADGTIVLLDAAAVETVDRATAKRRLICQWTDLHVADDRTVFIGPDDVLGQRIFLVVLRQAFPTTGDMIEVDLRTGMNRPVPVASGGVPLPGIGIWCSSRDRAAVASLGPNRTDRHAPDHRRTASVGHSGGVGHSVRHERRRDDSMRRCGSRTRSGVFSVA
jgi:hypothetical protein